jgi:hypothetical protein
MPILPRRSTTAATMPDEIEVPNLRADPRYEAASSLLSSFRDRFIRLQQERDRLILDHALRGKPADPKSSADAVLRQRLAQMQALPPLPAGGEAGSTTDTNDAIARGVALMAGYAAPKPQDHATQIADIDRAITVMHDAVIAQTEVVDEIHQQLTLEIANDLKPEWDALQLLWYRSAQDFAAMTRRVQDLRIRITAAGIGSRSDLLAMPNVRSPLMLGDETVWDSEISTWRRILERLGILS